MLGGKKQGEGALAAGRLGLAARLGPGLHPDRPPRAGTTASCSLMGPSAVIEGWATSAVFGGSKGPRRPPCSPTQPWASSWALPPRIPLPPQALQQVPPGTASGLQTLGGLRLTGKRPLT